MIIDSEALADSQKDGPAEATVKPDCQLDRAESGETDKGRMEVGEGSSFST